MIDSIKREVWLEGINRIFGSDTVGDKNKRLVAAILAGKMTDVYGSTVDLDEISFLTGFERFRVDTYINTLEQSGFIQVFQLDHWKDEEERITIYRPTMTFLSIEQLFEWEEYKRLKIVKQKSEKTEEE